MKNQHPHKNKVLKAQTGELIGAGYKSNQKDSCKIKTKGFTSNLSFRDSI